MEKRIELAHTKMTQMKTKIEKLRKRMDDLSPNQMRAELDTLHTEAETELEYVHCVLESLEGEHENEATA